MDTKNLLDRINPTELDSDSGVQLDSLFKRITPIFTFLNVLFATSLYVKSDLMSVQIFGSCFLLMWTPQLRFFIVLKENSLTGFAC